MPRGVLEKVLEALRRFSSSRVLAFQSFGCRHISSAPAALVLLYGLGDHAPISLMSFFFLEGALLHITNLNLAPACR
jgi:hypothetical protein